jgi:hypothetical protein
VKLDSQKKMTFLTPAQFKTDFPFLKEVDSLTLANSQLNLGEILLPKEIGVPQL